MAQVCTDCDPARPSTTVQATEQVPLQAQPPSGHPEQAQKETTQETQETQEKQTEAEFTPPTKESLTPSITIEFCDRCRWAPRATWIQTELFLTFTTPLLRSITLQPLNAPETGGRFRVWVYIGDKANLVWDRKTEGGFPELKVLKQRIRNLLQPDLDLGHSDVKPKRAAQA